MKERLTGAIILVALLVLLVPELLTGPGPEPAPLANGSEGAPLRSYTIDLADDAARRTASSPTSTPSTGATDEPAGQAVTDPEGEAGAEGAGESGAVSRDSEGVAISSGTSDAGSDGASERTSGSGADAAAASPPGSSTGTGQESAPGVDDDRPRSAFGPNAVSRAPAEPARSTAPATGSSSRPTASESSRAQAGSSRAAPSESSRATAEARRAAASESSRTAAEPRRSAAGESSASKGWAVQLGVFASRENAERLAKQIKGKGYAVTVNETSGNGKRLFRVRVGPEAERSAAVALGAKLRAAGHTGTVVAW